MIYISFSYIAYAKGGERERYNPLTGNRYDKQQTHDIHEAEVEPIASSSVVVSNRGSYAVRRGRPNFYKKNEDGGRWKGKDRSNSPYQRQTKDSSVKISEVNKAKEKP